MINKTEKEQVTINIKLDYFFTGKKKLLENTRNFFCT